MTIRATHLRGCLAAAAIALTLAISAACGGDDAKSTATTAPAASPTTSAATPGTITLSVSGQIAGQKGKMLLVSANAAGGGPQLARVCLPITSDSFAVPETAMTDAPAGNDPCSGSTPKTVFPKGSYQVSAGIYAPPAQQPDKTANATVQVADVGAKAQFDGAALSK